MAEFVERAKLHIESELRAKSGPLALPSVY